MPLPNYSTTVDHQKTAEAMSEWIVLSGLQVTRMYCLCGLEYKVRDNDTVDDFMYEIEYHIAVHPDVGGWDIAGADYYLGLDPGWAKMERIRG